MVSLITGGAGFIGSHLAEALLSQGDRVIILDDLSTGTADNVGHIRTNPALECHFDSVMNVRLLEEVVDEADVIFHLAAAVGVRKIIETPVRTIVTNVEGTELVLEAAAKGRKLVFIASTSEVYGKNDKVPFCEDDDLTLGPTANARWSYAASKALDEFLALAYWKEKRLPVVIGRLFNTVGPRQTGRFGMVLPTFVGQALDGVPLTVYGTGKQSRCFAYVGDAVEAIQRLIRSDQAVGEVVNIGSEDEISIEDLAALVKERTGSNSPIHLIPYAQAYEPGFEDMARRVPSLEKLWRLADFRPSTPLSDIVDKVVAHMATSKKAASPTLG